MRRAFSATVQTESADPLGFGRSKLYELLRPGRIRSIRIGSCRRIPAALPHEFVVLPRTYDERGHAS